MTAERLNILGLEINNISFSEALCHVKELASNRTPSYVCFANSHMTIEAKKDHRFANDVNNATLVLPDGMPLAFAFSILHNKKQERIAGMDFMPRLLSSLNKLKTSQPRVFFLWIYQRSIRCYNANYKDEISKHNCCRCHISSISGIRRKRIGTVY